MPAITTPSWSAVTRSGTSAIPARRPTDLFGDGLQADRSASYAASFGITAPATALTSTGRRSSESSQPCRLETATAGNCYKDGSELIPPLSLTPVSFPTRNGIGSEQYALLYGHGFPTWLQRSVRRWSSAHDIPLLSVGYSNDWADEQYVAARPANSPLWSQARRRSSPTSSTAASSHC